MPQIESLLFSRQLMFGHQSNFRAGHKTNTVMLNLKITPNVYLLVYLNISEAFYLWMISTFETYNTPTKKQPIIKPYLRFKKFFKARFGHLVRLIFDEFWLRNIFTANGGKLDVCPLTIYLFIRLDGSYIIFFSHVFLQITCLFTYW